MPSLVILDANALSLVGLRTLLERILPPGVEIVCCSRFAELQAVQGPVAHYFISAQMLVEHTAHFLPLIHQTIVTVSGRATLPQQSQFHVLDVQQPEDALVRALLTLMSHAHGHGQHLPARPQHATASSVLSPREIDVLSLIARGLINKEIADRLCISLTTVISHRKNIMDKLQLRSVSALTIYAVVNGYVDVSEI